jgi:hypothetical protein
VSELLNFYFFFTEPPDTLKRVLLVLDIGRLSLQSLMFVSEALLGAIRFDLKQWNSTFCTLPEPIEGSTERVK